MKKVFIIIILLLGVISMASAQSVNVEEFQARLQKFSELNKTICSDFEQAKKVVNITKVVESSGQMYFDNSGKLALIYEEPKGDKMIMQGADFEITTSGKVYKSDASQNPMLAQVAAMMRGCMSGDISLFSQGWSIEITKTSSGEYQVELEPTNRRIKRYILSMVMNFNPEDMTLNSLRMNEASGGYTDYRFCNKVFNKKIENIF